MSKNITRGSGNIFKDSHGVSGQGRFRPAHYQDPRGVGTCRTEFVPAIPDTVPQHPNQPSALVPLATTGFKRACKELPPVCLQLSSFILWRGDRKRTRTARRRRQNGRHVCTREGCSDFAC